MRPCDEAAIAITLRHADELQAAAAAAERRESRRCHACGAMTRCTGTRRPAEYLVRHYRCGCGARWQVVFRPLRFVRRDNL